MSKISDKSVSRSSKSEKIIAERHSKTHSGTEMRVVKSAPAVGSFSRADAKSAVMSVMRQNSKKSG